MSFSDSFSLEALSSISTNDLIVGVLLTTLSFIASVVVGSTSLGDGVFLQVSWGIVQGLIPTITANSSLGSDGMRVITIFMYIRMTILPFYLLHLLWKKKKDDGASKTSAAEAAKTSAVKDEKDQEKEGESGVPTAVAATANSTSSVITVADSPAPENIFSYTLFWIQVVPSVFWAIVGIMILQNVKSDEIAFYLGVICITFSFLYMALKMWKVSPARHSMPLWLQHLLSPQFLVEGTKDKITLKATIFVCLAMNLSGLMVTLAGVGAPPMMIVILLYEMPMNMTRVTFPVASVISSVFRTSYAMYAGLITFELWPFYLPATIIGFIGLKIGVGIGNVLSPSMYSATIFCLLILAGTVMLTKNPYVTVTAMVLACAGLLLKQFWWDKHYEAPPPMVPITAAGEGEGIASSVSGAASVDTLKSADTLFPSFYHVEDVDRHSRYCEAEILEMIS